MNSGIRTHKGAGALLRIFVLLCMAFLCTAAWESGKTSAVCVKAASSTSSSAKSSSKKGKWVKKNGGLKYRYSDKTYASGFCKIGDYWYHFSDNGTVDKGWFTVGKYTYYGSKSTTVGKTGRMAVGWATVSGKTYYFSESKTSGKAGRRMTGWLVKGGETYYLSKSGVIVTGLKKIDGKYFYFTKKGANGVLGKMVTGWYTIKSKKYYFRTTGGVGVKGSRCKSEWVTVDNESYYFNQDGVLNTDTTMLTTEQFISTVGKLASADMKESGILASVTIAQAILESGYGTSSLAVEANNLFGMKASLSGNTWKSSWTGTIFTKQTLEYLNGKWVTETCEFRKYSTIAQSIKDHSNYLAYAKNGSKLRYKGVVGNKSYKKTIKIIKKGGYATDPNYVKKVCALIKKYNLTKYDK